MPELSRFGGIVIYMLFRDVGQHNKPHVHAYYGEYEAVVGLDGELLAGSMPRKQLRMIVGWLAFHEDETYRAWNMAMQGEHFDKIDPMQETEAAMYIVDDICYAGEAVEGMKVVEAKLLRGRMLLATFSTGERRLFDATLLRGGAFEPLADEAVLADFTLHHGVVTWLDGAIDIAPEALYAESYPYLEDVA